MTYSETLKKRYRSVNFSAGIKDSVRIKNYKGGYNDRYTVVFVPPTRLEELTGWSEDEHKVEFETARQYLVRDGGVAISLGHIKEPFKKLLKEGASV